jgi:hypothetical protein
MRIAGFNDRGEARIVDERGNLVGYGELRLDGAELTGIEEGDQFPLAVVITWVPTLPDPDETDFDSLDWDELLR